MRVTGVTVEMRHRRGISMTIIISLENLKLAGVENGDARNCLRVDGTRLQFSNHIV
jgi:hypothetical protein